MGKIFLVISIICSIGAAVLGFIIGTQKNQYADMLTAAEQSLKSIPEAKYTGDFVKTPENSKLISASIANAGSTLKETQDTLATTQATLASTEQQLSEEQTKVLQLNTKLSETTTKLTAAEAKIPPLESKLAAATSELEGIKKDLGNDTISGLRGQIADLDEKANKLDGEVNALTMKNDDQRLKIEDLEERLNFKLTETAPLELDCKVVAINKQWNFVVLDAGKEKKLYEGVEMTVYRGKEFIGKVKTVSVDETTAVADILPEWSKSEIQVGDQALF